MPNDGEVVLTIGGASISGWTEVSVSRGIERMPSSFDLTLTEKYPGNPAALIMQAGDPCSVSIGGDLVITGYIDRFMPAIDKDSHIIRAVGRSKSADLVDCSAEWPNGQITGSSALQIAQKLATPYGIDVVGAVDTGAPIPQFNLTIGETAAAIMERINRYRGLLMYDQPDGAVRLDRAGSDAMGSGVKEGGNVQSAGAVYSMDERFSDYNVFLQAMDVMGDLGQGGNLKFIDQDTGVKRHRMLAIITEASGGGLEVAQQRGRWEVARRFGRGYQLSVLVDSWRDTDGKLWVPNASIPVDLPSLKAPAADWLIGNVTFSRSDDTGTTALLEIMPAEAFKPEPILLLPVAADVPPQAPQ